MRDPHSRTCAAPPFRRSSDTRATSMANSSGVRLYSLMNRGSSNRLGFRIRSAVCLQAQPVEDRAHSLLIRIAHHRVGEFLRNFQQRQRGMGCAVFHLLSHRVPLGLLVWWECNCLEYLKHAT